MSIPRPRRAQGKINLEEEAAASPRQAADANRVVATEQKRPPVIGRVIKAAIALILLLVTTLAAIYVIMVATIIATPTIGDQPILIVRGAYPVGQFPQGSLAAIQPIPVDRSMVGNVDDLTGIPGASVVQIIAGPYGALTTNTEGLVTVDGNPTTVQAQVAPQVLDDAYFVKCVMGPCGEPGSLTFIPTDYIIGQARGTLGTSGIGDIEVPANTVSDNSLLWVDRP